MPTSMIFRFFPPCSGFTLESMSFCRVQSLDDSRAVRKIALAWRAFPNTWRCDRSSGMNDATAWLNHSWIDLCDRMWQRSTKFHTKRMIYSWTFLQRNGRYVRRRDCMSLSDYVIY